MDNFTQHTDPVEEALEEPLECVDAGVDAVLVEVLLQLGQVLLEYAVVVGLEAQQLREPLNEKSCNNKRYRTVDHDEDDNL